MPVLDHSHRDKKVFFFAFTVMQSTAIPQMIFVMKFSLDTIKASALPLDCMLNSWSVGQMNSAGSSDSVV